MVDSSPAPVQDSTIPPPVVAHGGRIFHKERLMEQQRPQHETGSDPLHSPTAYAAILLAIFVAMYLAVGAIVHLFGAPADARVRTEASELASDAATQAADADRTPSSHERADAHTD